MNPKIEIAHLFMTKGCDHDCPLCCNNLYDINKIPCITNEVLSHIYTLCLTGGEPFYVGGLGWFIARVREQFPNIKNVYAYTSGGAFYYYMTNYWMPSFKLEGLTISPKDERDWDRIAKVFSEYPQRLYKIGSKRLVVFEDQIKNFEKFKEIVGESNINLLHFQVLGRKWDTTFNTPDNEGFYRLPILF